MGASLSCSSKGSVLLVVAANGDLSTAQELLKIHPRAVLYTNFKDRSSPLIQAAARGHFEILQLLLETAVQVEGPERAKRHVIDHRNSKRQTALCVASKHGHPDCVECLVANGADPLCVDSRRHNTCLHFAVLYGHTECVNKLLGSQAPFQQQGRPVSQILCLDEDTSVTRFVDRHNGWGLTATHIAVFQGNANSVRALLRHGASLDAVIAPGEIENSPIRCSPGSNALHIAAHIGNISMAKVILEAQESVPGLDLRSMTDSAGMKPGDYAQHSRNPLLVHILDERLPVPLLRQIWVNYSLEQSMPPRHQTLDAMLQKLRLMFNLEIIAVQRNLAHTSPEEYAAGTGPLLHSASSITRHSILEYSRQQYQQQYQQLQQRAQWSKRLEEVQVLLDSATRLHASLQGLCRKATEGSSTETSHAAVLDFILSTLITPRTVSAIVYAAKKLVCSNVMAVVAAPPAGSPAPALPAEMDVQHGVALLSTAMRAVETCLQTASYLWNPAVIAAEAGADLPMTADVPQHQPPANVLPQQPAQETLHQGMPTSGAAPQQQQTPAAFPASLGSLNDPATGTDAAAAATTVRLTVDSIAVAAAGSTQQQEQQQNLASHWSAHLHSVIAQLQWDIGVQRHRRRRQHAAAQAAARAAAAVPSSDTPAVSEADVSLSAAWCPGSSTAPAGVRLRHRQSSRSAPPNHLIAAFAESGGLVSLAPSRLNLAVCNVAAAGDATPPLPLGPAPGGTPGPTSMFSERGVASTTMHRSLSLRSGQVEEQAVESTPTLPADAAGMASVSASTNSAALALVRPAAGEILPQNANLPSANGTSNAPNSIGCTRTLPPAPQLHALAADKRAAQQGILQGDLSEDLSAGEEGAGSVWSDEDSTVCSICMDKPVAVQVTGCQHGLCVQCAFQLTVKGRELPCCPFCRQKIPAFEARPASFEAASRTPAVRAVLKA